jgi:glycerate kinase
MRFPSTFAEASGRDVVPPALVVGCGHAARAAVRVLIAPDKFRGTITAPDAATALAAGVRQAGHNAIELPLADGGEGTLEVFGGPNRQSTVTGPLGGPVVAGWRRENRAGAGEFAVVESALASGLLLAGGAAGNDPIGATSRGTGELIAAALDEGADRVLVGLGGSAGTDGGRGAIDALAGHPHLGSARIDVACDVTTRFLDAAAVFGPQKGAGPDSVAHLTRRLVGLAAAYRAEFGVDVRELPGSGAAGGLAGGLAALGARLVPGFDTIAALLGFESRLDAADLVLTGEGRLDRTSGLGKVVGSVTARAAVRGLPVIAFAGVVTDPGPLPGAVTVVSLTERFGALRCRDDAARCLTEACAQLLAGR